MGAEIIEWFVPSSETFEWVGYGGDTIALVEQRGESFVAAVIGPPGLKGNPGLSDDFDPGDLAAVFESA